MLDVLDISQFPLSEYVDENPYPVLRVSKEGEVLYANPVGESLLRVLDCTIGTSLPESVVEQLRIWDSESGNREIEILCGERLYLFRISAPLGKPYLNLFGHDTNGRPSDSTAYDAAIERMRSTILVELAKSKAIARGNLKAALKEITEASAEILNCERVSVWLYDEKHTKIHCTNLYELSKGRHSQGYDLPASKYPAYFEALETERALAAHDALHDPRTSQLADSYLVPLRISSMLDAPLRVKGRVIGVMCHEHIGPPRLWRSDEMVFAGNMTDFITLAFQSQEQRKSRQALRESERWQRLARQVGHVGAFDWRIQTGESRWTPEWEAMHGLPPNSFAGTYEAWEKMVHPDDRTEFARQIQHALEHGGFEGEWRVIWPDGTIHWLRGRAWGFKDHSGKIARLIGIKIDITDRKNREQELVRTSENLKRSNRDLELFAHVASHDLQEPVRTIRSFLMLLEDRYKDRLDADAKDYIRFAVDGASRLQEQIQGLLQYSRSTSETSELAPTDVAEVLKAVLDDLAEAIKENGVEVTYDNLPTVLADSLQLRQLFLNLIGNAIKFRAIDRPCRIRISAQKIGNEWVFSIADNGIGFDPIYQERIFAIFHRIRTADMYPGSGIGLAICKRIIERHGGRIWAESRECEGSTFYFTLRTV